MGSLLCLVSAGYAQADIEEARIKVAMRSIGHELLLQSGDSVSRVLAVKAVQGRYQIEFAEKFQLNPSDLVTTVKEVVLKSKVANNYLVEVEYCGSHEVVYSYQVGGLADSELIPCGGRLLPKNCYKIFFTILDVRPKHQELASNSFFTTASISLVLGAIVFIGLIFYGRGRKPQYKADPNTIWIGDYSYDKKTMILSYKGTETELSSKEADLLLLLYSEENKVLERENILKVVWGDKGDYVGRTLDVFISKLRKKLAADPNLKIVNIRGIGYKFILADKK